MSQWLLAIDMLSESHCANACGSVSVVRSADGDGVHCVAHLAKQLAVVMKEFRFGVLLCFLLQPLIIDVAQSNNLAVLRSSVGVARTFATDSDTGDGHSFIG
jgi:hypothetical protein